MLRLYKYISVILATLAPPAFAADLQFNFHGFVGTSAYFQTSPDFLLNGQGPLVLLNTNHAPTFGFDVRQSRMNLSATGPTIMGGAASGVFEMDFFGGDTSGNYGEVSATPRLRLAFSEVKWDNLSVRVGQDWQLLWVQSAMTQAHIAFPVNYFSGLVAWREPGVGVYYKMATGASSNLEFAGQVLKSDWQNPLNLGTAAQATSSRNNLNVDAGQLSARPGLEARVKWQMDTTALAYIAGHYNRVGASHAHSQIYQGADASPAATTDRDFDVALVKIGGKYAMAGFTLMAEGYMGKNTGPLIGNINQFPVSNDIKEQGGWAQLSYLINDVWTVAADAGTAMPKVKDSDLNTGETIRSNTNYTFMLQHKAEGFAVAPEISFIRTTMANGDVASGAQYALTGNYFF